jgi:hypothetical protein
MGYAKEISAWVCDDARNQREVMLDAWSQAFEEGASDTDVPLGECLQPVVPL